MLERRKFRAPQEYFHFLIVLLKKIRSSEIFLFFVFVCLVLRQVCACLQCVNIKVFRIKILIFTHSDLCFNFLNQINNNRNHNKECSSSYSKRSYTCYRLTISGNTAIILKKSAPTKVILVKTFPRYSEVD